MNTVERWKNPSNERYLSDVKECVSEELGITVTQVNSFNGKSSNDIYKVHGKDKSYIVKIFSYPYIEPGMAKGAGFVQKILADKTDIVPENYFVGEYGEIPYHLHISEYINNPTVSQDWRYLFDSQKQQELIETLGQMLSTLQEGYSFEESGEIVGYTETDGFKMRTSPWENTVKQIFNRRRDHCYEVDILDKTLIDRLVNCIEPIIDNWSISYGENVLCHNDMRLPNITVAKDGLSSHLVDWDNVAVGDWVFGYTRAEYTISNKTSQMDFSIQDGKDIFRKEFFDNSTQHETLPNRYYVYRAIAVLQEIRSFQYWYQNKSTEFKNGQKNWLENEINRIVTKIENTEL